LVLHDERLERTLVAALRETHELPVLFGCLHCASSIRNAG
jgi:hypothetical protein